MGVERSQSRTGSFCASVGVLAMRTVVFDGKAIQWQP
jgi:hypothetical protein